jgi:hypothetical protein
MILKFQHMTIHWTRRDYLIPADAYAYVIHLHLRYRALFQDGSTTLL